MSYKAKAPLLTASELKQRIPDVAKVASDFYGIAAPKDTPPEIVARLNQETNAWLNDPAIKARLTDLGGMITGGTPEAAARLIIDETEKWAKVIKFAGAKAE